VILPNPGNARWTARRKRAVLLALDLGEISEEEICRRYDMHPDELSAWRRGKVYALRANRRRRLDRISEGPSPPPPPDGPPTRSRGGS
jgi:transposase-like protein